MSDFLFVYGTLLPGQAPASMREVCDRMQSLGGASVTGILYDLGAYPGVVIGSTGRTVRGEVIEVDCEDTWRRLDRYEGCPQPNGEDGLFRRVKTVAALESGESIECWVYVYNRALRRARVVESGCWRTHRSSLPPPNR